MSAHTYEAVEARVTELLSDLRWSNVFRTSMYLHTVALEGGLTTGELEACWGHYYAAKDELVAE